MRHSDIPRGQMIMHLTLTGWELRGYVSNIFKGWVFVQQGTVWVRQSKNSATPYVSAATWIPESIPAKWEDIPADDLRRYFDFITNLEHKNADKD